MSIDKSQIRQRLLRQRLNLPANEVKTRSLAITQKVLAEIDLREITKVHIYQSVHEWREVETDLIIKSLRQLPDLNLVVQETKKGTPIPKAKFDLIIVPVVGFDKDKFRLGLGAGWYDRFLLEQPQALKIGLAYNEAFIRSGLPHEPHDIPLDKIITG